MAHSQNHPNHQPRHTMSLHEYKTGECIRPATEDEAFASDAASLKDGGAGVIIVEINGVDVPCYVVE